MTRNLRVSLTKPLKGEITLPGDKSISHRTIMIGSLAGGRTKINRISHFRLQVQKLRPLAWD